MYQDLERKSTNANGRKAIWSFNFYEDTFNELVPEIYDEAIKANNVEAVSRPQIDIQQMEKGKI